MRQYRPDLQVCETAAESRGYLQVDVVNEENNFPVTDAVVTVQSRERAAEFWRSFLPISRDRRSSWN